MSNRVLYINNYEHNVQISNDLNYPIISMRLNHSNATFSEILYWNIACLGKVKAYCVYDNEVLIHRSLVVKGKTKFTFLKKNDLEIGPCWTAESYRGKGIYPLVLSSIINDELIDGGNAYMIVEESNIPSRKGILKVGFIETNYYVEKGFLKTHHIVNK